MSHCRPPNAGKGRGRGSLNKSTRIIKVAVAQFVANNMVAAQQLFDRLAERDPEAALALLAKFTEFVLPRNAHLTAEIEPRPKPPSFGIRFDNGGPGRSLPTAAPELDGYIDPDF